MACRLSWSVTSSVCWVTAWGAGQDVESEVAAALGPFVVLSARTAPTSRMMLVRWGAAIVKRPWRQRGAGRRRGRR